MVAEPLETRLFRYADGACQQFEAVGETDTCRACGRSQAQHLAKEAALRIMELQHDLDTETGQLALDLD